MAVRYIPIEIETRFDCAGATLEELRHGYAGGEDGHPLIAYFSLPLPETPILKINFPHADIVRVLDEVYLSTEETDMETTGLVHRHFAYRVENSRFGNSQSEVYREIYEDAVHYRFITGGACLDVLSIMEPEFAVVGSVGE